MILVLSGTRDGRDIIKGLIGWGYQVMASTVTEYGKLLIQQQEDIPVIEGGLDARGLEELVGHQNIQLVVDATHPFAARISQMAVEVCRGIGIPYIRYEREGTQIQWDREGIFQVDNFQQAAYQALKFPQNVFLTIGSNQLETFCDIIPLQRIIARVLPLAKVLEKCQALGLTPGQIIAIQGPFSKELNQALFRQFQAGVVVTKDSGHTGGAEDKIQAATDMGIPVIIIKRPLLHYPRVVGTIEGLYEAISTLQGL